VSTRASTALAASLFGAWLAVSPVSLPLHAVPAAQSDLDGLMQKVLARRDENWK
jgi:hypothetical protein